MLGALQVRNCGEPFPGKYFSHFLIQMAYGRRRSYRKRSSRRRSYTSRRRSYRPRYKSYRRRSYSRRAPKRRQLWPIRAARKYGDNAVTRLGKDSVLAQFMRKAAGVESRYAKAVLRQEAAERWRIAKDQAYKEAFPEEWAKRAAYKKALERFITAIPSVSRASVGTDVPDFTPMNTQTTADTGIPGII